MAFPPPQRWSCHCRGSPPQTISRPEPAPRSLLRLSRCAGRAGPAYKVAAGDWSPQTSTADHSSAFLDPVRRATRIQSSSCQVSCLFGCGLTICRRLLKASIVAASILSADGPAFLHCIARVAQSPLPKMPCSANCHSVHRGPHDAFTRRCLRGVIGANVLDALPTSLESSTASLETSSCPVLACKQRQSANWIPLLSAAALAPSLLESLFNPSRVSGNVSCRSSRGDLRSSLRPA
jgi:hypothetical protein